jgi:cytoskeletal protein CcmA (bactofilin family)
MSALSQPEFKNTAVNTLLGKGTEFEGKLTFEGTVQIDGKFSGEIFSEGTLILGEGSKVKAEISVDTLIHRGEIVGNVKSKNAIELHSTSRFKGNIMTPSLQVERGAVFDGNCSMEGSKASQAQMQNAIKNTNPAFPLK